MRQTGVRRSNPFLTWRWLATATAAALLVGSSPAAGFTPAGRGVAVAAGPAALPVGVAAPVLVPGFAAPGFQGPAQAVARQAAAWRQPPGLEVNRDGSAADGESVLRAVDRLALVGADAGLPGGLRLAHPVSTLRITSPFGWRANPTGSGHQIHIGQDYAIACGSPVRAAEAGTVVQSAWAGHSGNRITVDHGSGVRTAYSHNSLLVARVGDRVEQGALVALSGTTGNSTGCHVHFEVYLNGKWTDPALYLPSVPGQPRPLTPAELRSVQGTVAAGVLAGPKAPIGALRDPSLSPPRAAVPPAPTAPAPRATPPSDALDPTPSPVPVRPEPTPGKPSPRPAPPSGGVPGSPPGSRPPGTRPPTSTPPGTPPPSTAPPTTTTPKPTPPPPTPPVAPPATTPPPSEPAPPPTVEPPAPTPPATTPPAPAPAPVDPPPPSPGTPPASPEPAPVDQPPAPPETPAPAPSDAPPVPSEAPPSDTPDPTPTATLVPSESGAAATTDAGSGASREPSADPTSEAAAAVARRTAGVT
ncbi:MAG: M23 family metallopeptidase [Arthrobacter sp.]|uniref:M23 family metallopeptidase n=1 Tax=Arthrobacter sp. TaxID=1667 RepID=UPI00346B73D6